MVHRVINLEILSDGTNTVTRTRYWGKGIDPIEGAGSAHRDRADKPDTETGELLATAAALEALAARLRKRANGRVKHADEIKRHKAEIASKPPRNTDEETAGYWQSLWDTEYTARRY